MRDLDDIQTLADYQFEQLRTAKPDEKFWRLTIAGLGIAGESGEVADLIKKIVAHGHGLGENQGKLETELGDVLWYVSEICSALGVDLAAIARKNIGKLRDRYPDGFDPLRS